MPARYDIYESPAPDGNEERRNIHARLVTDGTIETADLATRIQYSSSLTASDIEAVLSALSHEIGELLKEGRRIHVNGLGYFQMTLKCPQVKSAKEVRGDAVEFKSVSFRPENKLKIKLKKTQFLRSDRRNIHSRKYRDNEIDDLLTDYFKDHTYITRKNFEILCSFTSSTAARKIKVLVEEGKLKKEGNIHSPFYEPVAGYFGIKKNEDRE